MCAVQEISVEILRKFWHRTAITDDKKLRKLQWYFAIGQHQFASNVEYGNLILLFTYFAFCKCFVHASVSLFRYYKTHFQYQSLLHLQIPGDFVIQGKHGIQHCKTSLESVKFNKQLRNQWSQSLSRFSKDFIPAPQSGYLPS